MAVKPANTSIWIPQISMITCTNEADLYFTNEFLLNKFKHLIQSILDFEKLSQEDNE